MNHLPKGQGRGVRSRILLSTTRVTLQLEMTGRTMLHEACKLNYTSVVEALLYRNIHVSACAHLTRAHELASHRPANLSSHCTRPISRKCTIHDLHAHARNANTRTMVSDCHGLLWHSFSHACEIPRAPLLFTSAQSRTVESARSCC